MISCGMLQFACQHGSLASVGHMGPTISGTVHFARRGLCQCETCRERSMVHPPMDRGGLEECLARERE